MRMIIDAHGQYFPDHEAFAELARQVDHDLRSPLTAICSYAECLAWLTALDMDTRERYARAIIAEARRLGRMAAYFTSLVSPPEEQDLQEVSLLDLAREVVDELQDLLDLQESLITVVQPEQDLPLVWPRAVLRQIILGAVETMVEWGGSRCRLELRMEACTGSELSFSAELCGPQTVECDLSRFGYRSALALLQAHGGQMALLTEGTRRLCLHLPYVGRVKPALSERPLERSA